MLNGALGAAGGALSSSYLRAETLEDALAALKREAGLSDLSDEEAVERAQQFRRQNLLQQATQAYPGQVYDIGKLLDNAGTSLSDTTMQIISNITGMDYSGVSGNSSNNLNRQQRALLALGELSDLTNLSPVAGQEIDREAIYRQAYAEAEADYANRILNAVNSLNTKRRNNQDKRETLQEDYLKDMRELADQTEEDSEDALQDSIKKGTARSSILDGLQAEIEQKTLGNGFVHKREPPFLVLERKKCAAPVYRVLHRLASFDLQNKQLNLALKPALLSRGFSSIMEL